MIRYKHHDLILPFQLYIQYKRIKELLLGYRYCFSGSSWSLKDAFELMDRLLHNVTSYSLPPTKRTAFPSSARQFCPTVGWGLSPASQSCTPPPLYRREGYIRTGPRIWDTLSRLDTPPRGGSFGLDERHCKPWCLRITHFPVRIMNEVHLHVRSLLSPIHKGCEKGKDCAEKVQSETRYRNDLPTLLRAKYNIRREAGYDKPLMSRTRWISNISGTWF